MSSDLSAYLQLTGALVVAFLVARFLWTVIFGPKEVSSPNYEPTTHFCTVCGHGTYEHTEKCPGCGEDFTKDWKDESPCKYCGSQWSHDDDGNCKHCGAHE